MTFIVAKTSRNTIESAGHAYSMPQVSVSPRGNTAGRYRGEKAISKKREENEEEAEEGMRAGSHLEEMGFRGGSSAASLMLGIR